MNLAINGRQCILVTGANGLVGAPLCEQLTAAGFRVKAALRDLERGTQLPSEVEKFAVGSLNSGIDWSAILVDVETVVHLAGRVHVVRDMSGDALAEFRRVNVEATRVLARQAALAGVRRFVYVSSAKVNGEGGAVCYGDLDEPAPIGPYAQSKLEAEQVLRHVEAETGLDVVILRPPLIYGPGVRANFLRLLQLVDRVTFLPFAAVRNRRSLIFLGNFVDALIRCLDSQAAAGKTFLVSDGVEMSTPELIRVIAEAMERKTVLFPAPTSLLSLLGKIVGKSAEVERLCGSLCLNDGRFREELGWTPPYAPRQGLQQTVEWFIRECDSQ